jgi:imidazolonepropionase
MIDVTIHGIGQLVTLAGAPSARRGAAMRDLGIVKGAAIGASTATGKIEYVGADPGSNWPSTVDVSDTALHIHAAGRLVTPGLIDSHTHLVYAGSRANEFYMRAQGKSYLEIAKAGGGIGATVAKTREAPLEALVEVGLANVRRMVACGTTTIEAKSGYGLNLEDEVKMLKAIRHVGSVAPLTIARTLLAAHAVPPEFASHPDSYVDLVCTAILSQVRARALASYFDAFIEEGAFTIEQGRRMLEAAKAAGFPLKVHVDEFADLGGAKLAVEFGALSADHLGAVSDDGIEALAASQTVATLLPGTIFFVNSEKYAPARKLIDAGAAVALATDHNPGSCTLYSLPAVMTVAALKMRMTAEECIAASTINGAAALGLAKDKGSIEVGKDADLVIWDTDDYANLPYMFAANLAKTVIAGGQVVAEKEVATF